MVEPKPLLRDLNPIAADLFDEMRRHRIANGDLRDAAIELCAMLDVMCERKAIRPGFRDLVKSQADRLRETITHAREAC